LRSAPEDTTRASPSASWTVAAWFAANAQAVREARREREEAMHQEGALARGRFELGDASLQRVELLARALQHLRLHVVLLARHEVEARERAREHAAKVLFEVPGGIG
jgi:hypothetical protein